MSSAPERTPWAAVIAFLAAAACGAGFAVCYSLHLGTEALGLTLGGACAALAVGLAVWSKAIDAAEPDYVEERAVGPTPPEEYDGFREALTTQPVRRAGLLWGALGIALGTTGIAALFPLRSMLPRADGSPDRIFEHTGQSKGTRLVDENGKPVKPDDLDEGSTVTVFPEGLDPRQHVDTTTVLVKVNPDDLQLPEDRQSWAISGVVAYSKLCTHAGCPVGLYADSYQQLMCPCHFSIFDVLKGAEPVEGPAARPLPQLPLGLDADGYLVAEGDFSAPVGPAWWGYDA